MLSQEVAFLAPIAAETEELADVLWAEYGVVSLAEKTVKALETTRHHQAQLNRIAELTSRKFEAYGHRGSATRWWPDVPEDFPETGTTAKIIQELDEEIPQVEHGLIIYEQLRSGALDLLQKYDARTPDRVRRGPRSGAGAESTRPSRRAAGPSR